MACDAVPCFLALHEQRNVDVWLGEKDSMVGLVFWHQPRFGWSHTGPET